MAHRLRLVLLGLAVVALAVLPSPVASAGPTAPDQTVEPQWFDQRCANRFDRAVQTYQTTFPERDLDTLGELLHPEITIVLANGTIIHGKDQAIAALEPFFADDRWTQTFDELTRTVNGCRSAFVLFDSVLSYPSGFRQHTLLGLTFTLDHGRWLILHDQLTLLPD